MNPEQSIPGHERFPPLLALMRPQQWTKNLACLAGVFFSGKIGDATALSNAAGATAAFCLLSSCTYIFNDFMDREADRRHPVKCGRPLARGSVSLAAAALLAFVLATATMGLLWFLPAGVAQVAGAYLALSVAYSLGGKKLVVLDVLMIAVGFVLRILAGTAASGVVASNWILACGFSIALFLGFSKRRAELAAINPSMTRAVLKNYSIGLLDRMCMVTAALTLCSYLLFTILAHEGKGFLLTFPPVVFGTLRYLYLLNERGCGEAPELVLWHDRSIQAAILVWVALYALVLYEM